MRSVASRAGTSTSADPGDRPGDGLRTALRGAGAGAGVWPGSHPPGPGQGYLA